MGKGERFIEHVLTYGWAYLVVLIVIAALLFVWVDKEILETMPISIERYCNENPKSNLCVITSQDCFNETWTEKEGEPSWLSDDFCYRKICTNKERCSKYFSEHNLNQKILVEKNHERGKVVIDFCGENELQSSNDECMNVCLDTYYNDEVEEFAWETGLYRNITNEKCSNIVARPKTECELGNPNWLEVNHSEASNEPDKSAMIETLQSDEFKPYTIETIVNANMIPQERCAKKSIITFTLKSGEKFTTEICSWIYPKKIVNVTACRQKTEAEKYSEMPCWMIQGNLWDAYNSVAYKSGKDALIHDETLFNDLKQAYELRGCQI